MELNNEIMNTLEKLGELIKADSRCKAIEKTAEEYQSCREIASAVDEYNALQEAIAAENDKGTDESVISVMKERADELYESVIANPVYVAYQEAADEYEAFVSAVYEEFEFAVTGKRPCEHDCSCCGGGCH